MILKKSINLLQPDFKVKMHQIQCRLGLRRFRPRWGSLQRCPGLAGFKEPILLREGNGWQKEKGLEETEREGTEEKVSQGLVHTPMSQILKRTLTAGLI